jgi:hypothetical protein
MPPAQTVDAPAGAIWVKNSGGFVATFSVQYEQDGQLQLVEEQNFTTGVAKSIVVPPDATRISVVMKIAVFIQTWSTVATYDFDKPVKKCFELSGTTLSPTCHEIACAE